MEWFARHATPPTDRNMTAGCLYNVLPLMGLWNLLAALVAASAVRRELVPKMSWTERYGLFLSLAWSPLGVWMLVDIYRDVLR